MTGTGRFDTGRPTPPGRGDQDPFLVGQEPIIGEGADVDEELTPERRARIWGNIAAVIAGDPEATDTHRATESESDRPVIGPTNVASPDGSGAHLEKGLPPESRSSAKGRPPKMYRPYFVTRNPRHR